MDYFYHKIKNDILLKMSQVSKADDVAGDCKLVVQLAQHGTTSLYPVLHWLVCG